MAPQNVCRYNKFGHCKFSEVCRLMHVNELCENLECEVTNCNLRHPKICNYFRDYRRCKFGEYCSFRHEENTIDNLRSDIQKTSEKVNSLEAIILEKADLDDRIEVIDKKIEEMDVYLAQFQSLQNQIEKRDKSIEDLEKKVYVMGEQIGKFENQCAENALENSVLIEEKFKTIEWKVYKLERKNAGADFCEYCDVEFQEYEDLRLHIRDAHTFKCDICEISLGNKENLDMHLLTCEIYKCFTCDYVNKRLCELKSHCKTKHEGNTFIQHFKMNIDNFKEKTCKSYRSIDI